MTKSRKLPTMADVAQRANVSPMTVSRAFKSDASVSEPTREAILAAADELGYVFDSAASNFRSQRSDFVAVTIPSINNANFAETVGGLTDGLKDAGLKVLLGYTNYDTEKEEQLIEQLLGRRPRAIVVTGGKHTPRARRMLLNAGIPVVETWDLPTDPIGHVVGFSNAAAVRDMVDHFVAVGYRRIAFIGGDAQRDTRGTDRRLGFIAAMRAHGLDTSRLIAGGTPPISMREGAEAMSSLLDRFPDTEGVICVSDPSAFGALTECQRRGIDVPDRMAIAGFGNYEIADISVPSLTTIDPFPGEIGRETARLITELTGSAEIAPRIVTVAPKIILRETVRRV